MQLSINDSFQEKKVLMEKWSLERVEIKPTIHKTGNPKNENNNNKKQNINNKTTPSKKQNIQKNTNTKS